MAVARFSNTSVGLDSGGGLAMNRGNGIRAFVTVGALGLALGVPLSAAQAQTLAASDRAEAAGRHPLSEENAKGGSRHGQSGWL